MPEPLLDWLHRRHPTMKRQTLRRMIQAGRVRLNGKAAQSAKQPVEASDQVEVLDQAPTTAEAPHAGRRSPRDARVAIVHEDDDLLVVDKPPGLLTSTVPREPRPTLLAAVREYVAAQDPRARVGLIHRLDRDASGLLVFSKSHRAFVSLKEQFFHHTVERVYLALILGKLHPPAGRIESRLVERADGTVHSTRQVGKGELAITNYETLEQWPKRSLVRVTLQTGRKHQIRVHLRERGCPIRGDTVYGPIDTASRAPRLMLAAVRLAFDHPLTGQRVAFEIPPPKEFSTDR